MNRRARIGLLVGVAVFEVFTKCFERSGRTQRDTCTNNEWVSG